MSQVYESLYIVNSFHAVNYDTGETIPCDAAGVITPAPGTTIVFPSPVNKDKKSVSVNTILVYNGATPLLLEINGNTMYPFYVGANHNKGLNYVRVHTIKVLSGGPFYIEGLSSET